MRKQILIILPMIYIFTLQAQPNCNVFLWEGDTLQYKACKLSERFEDYYQFDMKAIEILDSCLSICPHYAFAQYEYGVVYLKAGNFVGWNKYINAAVKYDPNEYLGLRASCRGKFFADYQGAIDDIDSLASIVDYDIGFVHDGAYHLDAYKALCHKAMGQTNEAIELFENHLIDNNENIGLFDYIHLGVAYQEMNKHQKAIRCFLLQEEINDLAENKFYLAKSYLALNKLEAYNTSINQAKKKLATGQKITDGYHVMEDEIFLSDIEKLQESFDKKSN